MKQTFTGEVMVRNTFCWRAITATIENWKCSIDGARVETAVSDDQSILTLTLAPQAFRRSRPKSTFAGSLIQIKPNALPCKPTERLRTCKSRSGLVNRLNLPWSHPLSQFRQWKPSRMGRFGIDQAPLLCRWTADNL
jgi:hypothetical protein